MLKHMLQNTRDSIGNKEELRQKLCQTNSQLEVTIRELATTKSKLVSTKTELDMANILLRETKLGLDSTKQKIENNKTETKRKMEQLETEERTTNAKLQMEKADLVSKIEETQSSLETNLKTKVKALGDKITNQEIEIRTLYTRDSAHENSVRELKSSFNEDKEITDNKIQMLGNDVGVVDGKVTTNVKKLNEITQTIKSRKVSMNRCLFFTFAMVVSAISAVAWVILQNGILKKYI